MDWAWQTESSKCRPTGADCTPNACLLEKTYPIPSQNPLHRDSLTSPRPYALAAAWPRWSAVATARGIADHFLSTATYTAPRQSEKRAARLWHTGVGLARDEFTRELHKNLKLIVMHPVSGAVDTFHGRILEVLGATINTRIGGAAFIAIDQQRWAGDAGPQLFDFRVRHVVGRP